MNSVAEFAKHIFSDYTLSGKRGLIAKITERDRQQFEAGWRAAISKFRDIADLTQHTNPKSEGERG